MAAEAGKFDFEVVHRPGVNAVEINKQDQREIDDQILCFSIGSLEFRGAYRTTDLTLRQENSTARCSR